MPVPSHSKRWNSQGRAACFTFHLTPAGISSPPSIASPPHSFRRSCLKDPWKELWNRSKIRAGMNNPSSASPVMGRFPCGAAMRAPAARSSTWRGKEESQDLGSTSKTAAGEAARKESLSPKEYKNQWGDEQGSNCKNSNRGKYLEKRRTEDESGRIQSTDMPGEGAIDSNTCLLHLSERAAFATESLTKDWETTFYMFKLLQLDFCPTLYALKPSQWFLPLQCLKFHRSVPMAQQLGSSVPALPTWGFFGTKKWHKNDFSEGDIRFARQHFWWAVFNCPTESIK